MNVVVWSIFQIHVLSPMQSKTKQANKLRCKSNKFSRRSRVPYTARRIPDALPFTP